MEFTTRHDRRTMYSIYHRASLELKWLYVGDGEDPSLAQLSSMVIDDLQHVRQNYWRVNERERLCTLRRLIELSYLGRARFHLHHVSDKDSENAFRHSVARRAYQRLWLYCHRIVHEIEEESGEKRSSISLSLSRSSPARASAPAPESAPATTTAPAPESAPATTIAPAFVDAMEKEKESEIILSLLRTMDPHISSAVNIAEGQVTWNMFSGMSVPVDAFKALIMACKLAPPLVMGALVNIRDYARLAGKRFAAKAIRFYVEAYCSIYNRLTEAAVLVCSLTQNTKIYDLLAEDLDAAKCKYKFGSLPQAGKGLLLSRVNALNVSGAMLLRNPMYGNSMVSYVFSRSVSEPSAPAAIFLARQAHRHFSTRLFSELEVESISTSIILLDLALLSGGDRDKLMRGLDCTHPFSLDEFLQQRIPKSIIAARFDEMTPKEFKAWTINKCHPILRELVDFYSVPPGGSVMILSNQIDEVWNIPYISAGTEGCENDPPTVIFERKYAEVVGKARVAAIVGVSASYFLVIDDKPGCVLNPDPLSWLTVEYRDEK